MRPTNRPRMQRPGQWKRAGTRAALAPHVAVLELLPAAAGAGVVAADALAAVADRFDRLVVGRLAPTAAGTVGRAGIGIGAAVVRGRRRFVRGRSDPPQRTDEAGAFAFEPEDRAGDLLGDPLPHPFERL